MTNDEYSSHQAGIARVQANMDELSLKENVQNMHKKHAKEYRCTVDRIESSKEDGDESGDLPTDATEQDDTPSASQYECCLSWIRYEKM